YQLLNGEQALALARERYGYARGDFQRADNQRLVATAIMKQVLQTPALEMPSTIQRLAACVTTDMSVTDIIGLAQEYRSAGDLIVNSALAPSSTATIDGVSYVITDEAAWKTMMEKVDAGEDPGK
ncbi:MAG: LCP family protein, partial [Berryella intestinalis]|nr:LCP family protein [Berryella intestinalis]